jgi:hypothetical protein
MLFDNDNVQPYGQAIAESRLLYDVVRCRVYDAVCTMSYDAVCTMSYDAVCTMSYDAVCTMSYDAVCTMLCDKKLICRVNTPSGSCPVAAQESKKKNVLNTCVQWETIRSGLGTPVLNLGIGLGPYSETFSNLQQK